MLKVAMVTMMVGTRKEWMTKPLTSPMSAPMTRGHQERERRCSPPQREGRHRDDVLDHLGDGGEGDVGGAAEDEHEEGAHGHDADHRGALQEAGHVLEGQEGGVGDGDADAQERDEERQVGLVLPQEPSQHAVSDAVAGGPLKEPQRAPPRASAPPRPARPRSRSPARIRPGPHDEDAIGSCSPPPGPRRR